MDTAMASTTNERQEYTGTVADVARGPHGTVALVGGSAAWVPQGGFSLQRATEAFDNWLVANQADLERMAAIAIAYENERLVSDWEEANAATWY